MKKILILLLLIPFISKAQVPVEKYIPHAYYQTVSYPNLSASLPLKLNAAKQVTAAKILIGEADTTVGVGIIGWPRMAKLRDSLAALIGGGGGVTSVAAGYGMNFSTITSTGSVVWDSAVGVTKGTTQVISGAKALTNLTTIYENNVSAANQLRFINDGSNSGSKYATMQLQGATGFGLSGWPNAVVLENTAAGGFVLSNHGGGAVTIEYTSGRNIMQSFRAAGSFFGGSSTASAWVHLGAGTATAGQAPLKFTAGTNLGTTEAGAIEYDGTHLYFTATNGGSRFQLDQQSTGMTNPMTTTGDIIYSSSGSTPARLGIGTNGDFLKVVSGVPSWQPLSSLLSYGTYSPTVTEVTNGGGVGATTVTTCQFMRVGDVVTVSGRMVIDPASISVLTEVRLTIPVASNFSAVEQAGGTGNSIDGTLSRWGVVADATNDAVLFQAYPPSATGNTISFSFTYLII